jgi:hypothetical protein
MKFVIKTGKIYLTYSAFVWGYYFFYRNREELTNKTIHYWKNSILN